MKSHSFTSDDAAQNNDQALQYIAECFDPKYDKEYQNDTKSVELQRRCNKDIERGVFYIETPDGLIDLVAQCKLTKGQNHRITYQDMHKALTNDYKLSTQQTEYILAANYQGGIAGGLAGFTELKAKTYNNCYYMDGMNVIENEWARNGDMSKIIIDKDNNVSYVGGQIIMFDCSVEALPCSDLRAMVGTKFNSQDFMAINITATLGKLGATVPTEQVVIDVAGTGDVASKIINDLKTIETKCPTKNPTSIIETNGTLSKQLVTAPLNAEQYKEAVTERVSEILHSEQDEAKAITTLKKLDGVKEALADLLVKQIDQAIEAQKDKKTDKLSAESINDIARETARQLSKFIDQPDKYTMNKFSKDLVKERATSSGVIVPRKNFVEKICQYLKNKWHGYSYDKSKIAALEQLHDKAKIVGQAAKSHMSSKISISPPPHNKKEGARTI